MRWRQWSIVELSSLSELMDVEKIRNEFPALENYTWFQNGGVAITPNFEIRPHLMSWQLDPKMGSDERST